MTHIEPDFEQLYRQHARAVHRYLARRVGSELADDLTADTFVVAWRRRSSYDDRLGSPAGWLYGIATNLARRHRRREDAELRWPSSTAVRTITAIHPIGWQPWSTPSRTSVGWPAHWLT